MQIFICGNKHEFTVSDDIQERFWRCPLCGRLCRKSKKLNYMDRKRHETKLLNYGIQRTLKND